MMAKFKSHFWHSNPRFLTLIPEFWYLSFLSEQRNGSGSNPPMSIKLSDLWWSSVSSVVLGRYWFLNRYADHCSEINVKGQTRLWGCNVTRCWSWMLSLFPNLSSWHHRFWMRKAEMLHLCNQSTDWTGPSTCTRLLELILNLGFHTDPNHKSKEPFNMLVTLTDGLCDIQHLNGLPQTHCWHFF